ncbi:MAG: hypothetical protein KF729_09895 [Sandaracinaceae bacterium]|nr:hypothetical protein [Sandaracinaceae bacterium]
MLRAFLVAALWLGSAFASADAPEPAPLDEATIGHADACAIAPADAGEARSAGTVTSARVARLPAPSDAPRALAARPSQTTARARPSWQRVARSRSDHASDP